MTEDAEVWLPTVAKVVSNGNSQVWSSCNRAVQLLVCHDYPTLLFSSRIGFLVLALMLYYFLFSSPLLTAEVKQIEFGSLSQWQSARLDGANVNEEDDFVYIAPLSEEWALDDDTELLLHFNQQSEFDGSGKHRIISDYMLSSASAQGEGALFLNGHDGLLLSPSAGSLLGGDNGGAAFSIEFWFNPRYSANGEFLFEWSGLFNQGGLNIPQRLSAYFVEQRLVWELDNLFLNPERIENKIRLQSEALIPDRWYQHRLYYNSNNNEIELLLNNKLVDVAYATVDHRYDGAASTLLLSNPYRDPFTIGKNFHGYIDEFRISTSKTKPSYLRSPNYRSKSSALLPPIDLASNDSRLLSVGINASNPDRSSVLLFFHLTDSLNNETLRRSQLQQDRLINLSDDSLWQRLTLDDDLPITAQYQGRFLLLKVVFLGDSESLEPPRLSKIKIRYQQKASLPPPAGLKLEQEGRDSLRVSWSPIADSRVGGYRIYLGKRSGIYLQDGTPIDAGRNYTYLITNLTVEQQYYVTVVAYDTASPEQIGNYAPEQSIHILPYWK